MYLRSATGGSLDRFAVDFRQFDSAQLCGPSVTGSLRCNSSLALQGAAVGVPEPGTLALMLAALFLLVSIGGRQGLVKT